MKDSLALYPSLRACVCVCVKTKLRWAVRFTLEFTVCQIQLHCTSIQMNWKIKWYQVYQFRATIWPVSVPASVHEVYVGSVISNSSSGGTVAPLSGRLAPVRTISGASNRTDQSSDLSCDTTGPQVELQQKPVSPMSVGEVHRYTTGLEVDESLIITSEIG